MKLKKIRRRSKIYKKRRSYRNSKKRKSYKNCRKRNFGTILTKYNEKKNDDEQFLRRVAKKIDNTTKYMKTQLNKTSPALLSVSMLFLLIGYAIYMSYDKEKTSYEITVITFNFLMSGSVLGQHLLKDYLYMTIDNIKPHLTIDENEERISELLREFENLDKKITLPDDFRRFFMSCINQAKRAQDAYKIEKNKKTYDKETQNITLFMNFVLNFLKPKERQTISIDEITKLNNAFKEFIENYGDSKDDLIESIVRPILLYLGTNIEMPAINSIFLVGSPGVGKTHFVNEIAKKLDARIVKYNNEEDVDRIRVYEDFESQIKNLNPITQIAMSENMNKINILFIDEIDKILLRKDDTSDELIMFLLNILGDSSNKTIYDRSLNLNVKIPKNTIIICASNTSLVDLSNEIKQLKKALISRFREIVIPDLTKEIQLKLILEYMDTYKNVVDIDSEDEKFVSDVIYSANYKGLRELKLFVDNYINNKKAIEYFKQIDNTGNIEDFRKKYIEKIKNLAIEDAKQNTEDKD